MDADTDDNMHTESSHDDTDDGSMHTENSHHDDTDDGSMHGENIHDPDDGNKHTEDSDILQDIPLCNERKDEYLSKLQIEAKKAYHFPKEIRKKLRTLVIHLNHEVPESHIIETRLTHVPRQEKRALLRSLGVDLSHKRYDFQEDAIIHRNWKTFCKEYGFENPRPFLVHHLNHKSIMTYHQRIQFVQYLGNGLPHRTLYSIYGRFCALYNPRRKTLRCFGKEEDDIIRFHCTRGRSEKMSALSNLLGRSREAIRVRLRTLRYRYEGVMRWNMKYANEVLIQLMDATGSEHWEDLQYMNISEEIWKKVSRQCLIHPVTIKKFWERKLSTQLFAARPIYLNKMRIHLIERLFRDEIEDWSDISWSNIAKEDFEGVSPEFLKSVFKKMLKICYPDEKLKTLISNIEDVVMVLKFGQTEMLELLDDYCLQMLELDDDKKLQIVTQLPTRK